MTIDVISVQPKMFSGFLTESIVARAVRKGACEINVIDLRDYAHDRHRRVDDKPFGGGPGMLMQCGPWFEAVESSKARKPCVNCRVVMTSPAGRRFTQRDAQDLAKAEHVIFLCGHYEGFDARVETLATDLFSVGDFVMTGGELAAASMTDAVVRLLPGVLGGGAAATASESFGESGLLEPPQYTHPPVFRGLSVPEVLLSGDHRRVEAWKRSAAHELTAARRPDLLLSDVSAAKVRIIGHGLIGGSLEKAAKRAGLDVRIFDKGETPEVTDADFVLIAVPPSQVKPVMESISSQLPPKCIVSDMTGIKGKILSELAEFEHAPFAFISAHPMAGKERSGYANACADLFDGASMILVPFASTPKEPRLLLESLCRRLGFGLVVTADPAHHDEMIAFTSQLCHLISSAYVREGLAARHLGYSAGSFRDMVRVGAPDPEIWTELFLGNAAALLPVLKRYVGRMEDFVAAIEAGDRAALRAQLEEGVAAKGKMEISTERQIES